MPDPKSDSKPEPNKYPYLSVLLNPVVIVTLLIIGSVIVFIALAIFGWDHGVLKSMSQSQFARGLITYLFAVVTIGTSVVVVLSGLLGANDAATQKRFERGKEILSLLLGVFGTIVGFYFGSEVAGGTKSEQTQLSVSALDVAAVPGSTSGAFTVRAVVSGGEPPYEYGVGVNSSDIDADRDVRNHGWIADSVTVVPNQPATIRVVVVDAADHRVTSKLRVPPPP